MLARELLVSEYVHNGLSDREIALKYGFARHTIGYARSKYGISTRIKTGAIGEEVAARLLNHIGTKTGKSKKISRRLLWLRTTGKA